MVDEIKLELNDEGYLHPHRFEITLNDFTDFFVLRDDKNTREKLFKKFVSFCKRFNKIILKLWVNGSYTTDKLKPRDIDVAVHYDAIKFNDLAKTKVTEKLAFQDREHIKKTYSIHLLPVPVYPKNHPYFILTEKQSEKWDKLFLRDTRTNPHVDKGYIELKDRIS